MKSDIRRILSESSKLKEKILLDEELIDHIRMATSLCVDVLKQEGKILFCGNGGSAADAQHLAAELSGRFYLNRDPLFTEALHVNSSYLTAVANDYGFDQVFSRLVQSKGRQGDLLIGLSTSGDSENVIRALDMAKSMQMFAIGLTGANPGRMKSNTDVLIQVPSENTPRIQECHILIGHIICELVEKTIFGPLA